MDNPKQKTQTVDQLSLSLVEVKMLLELSEAEGDMAEDLTTHTRIVK